MKCEHIDTCDPGTEAPVQVCEECVKTGDTWVQVRVCKICGHTGCCDSSKNRHARAHFEETGHAIMGPADPVTGHGEWLWCYEHDSYVSAEGEVS